MRRRTKSREFALQMLYQVDIRHADWRQILSEFWLEHEAPQDVQEFANRLLAGTAQHLEAIDAKITKHADNWDMKRMAIVDRNILRMGVFELTHLDEVPTTVCINEAIELAKRFGDAESAKFINGILDAIHKKHPRSAAAASPNGGAP